MHPVYLHAKRLAEEVKSQTPRRGQVPREVLRAYCCHCTYLTERVADLVESHTPKVTAGHSRHR